MASKGFRSLFHRKKEGATEANERPRSLSNQSQREIEVNEPSPKYGLFLLNEQGFQDATKAGNARYSVDIIAIHGIDGHPYDSWTYRNGKMWLRDFLPDQLLGARIFTFGYPSEVAFTLATGKFEDFARSLLEGLNCVRRSSEELSRRIIFVCHSTGRVVVKQAIVTALIDAEDYANIRDSVIGILFLGTPHRGSSSAQFPQLLAHLASAALVGTSRFTGQMRTDLIKSLEKDSGILKTLSTNFRNSASNIKIISFIEQQTSPPLNQRVVDEVSGVMDIPRETIVPMDICNHSNICKFPYLDSSGYLKVSYHLEMLAKGSLNLSSSLQKLVFTVPFERDSNFVGRRDIFTEIDNRFKTRRRVALAGIGGVGKSQIAIEYCYRFRAECPEKNVFWIHASSFSRMDQAYKDIARTLKIPGCSDPNLNTFRLVSEWLNDDAHEGWLLILDNADDMEVFFNNKENTPSVGSSIMITTRDKRLGESLTSNEKAIVVYSMTIQESEYLFWSRLAKENIIDKRKATELLNALDISVEEYLEILSTEDSEFQNLLSENLVDLRRDFESPTSVIRTWKVSFDQIKRRKPRAAEMLSLMAVLDR